jgi:hypothetical protein
MDAVIGAIKLQELQPDRFTNAVDFVRFQFAREWPHHNEPTAHDATYAINTVLGILKGELCFSDEGVRKSDN